MTEKEKEEKSLEDVYKIIFEKYNLPDFDSLTHEFEILEVDSEKLALRSIRRKMIDKYDFYIKFIQEIIQPEADFLHMNESRVFTEEDKNGIYVLFKFMVVFDRRSIMLDLVLDDSKDAQFIIEAYDFWMENKDKLIVICDKAIKSWDLEDDNYKAGYLG